MTAPSSEHQPPSLAETLMFTPTDLDANRAGKLSDAQALRLRNRAGCSLIGGTILALLLAGAGFWLFANGAQIFASVLWGLAALLLFLNRSGRRSLTVERQQGSVAAVQGEAILNANDYANPNGTQTEYVINIGEQAFVVSRDAFMAFEDGNHYVVYYLPAARIVLSAEPIPNQG